MSPLILCISESKFTGPRTKILLNQEAHKYSIVYQLENLVEKEYGHFLFAGDLRLWATSCGRK